MWKNFQVEDIEVELFLTALKRRYGYDFREYAHSSLKRRLKSLKQYLQVEHLSNLLPQILYDDVFARTVINTITVQVSEFYRDPMVWRYLREQVIPRISSYPTINIWQAGCSEGEETYSLLIMLKEAGLLSRSRIIATDISEEALSKASLGVWKAKHFDHAQDNYKLSGGESYFPSYFEHSGNQFAINSEFRSRVDFMQHNLCEDGCFMEAQLVVCRNVLIYFNEQLQEKVCKLFHQSLQRGGYLVLGQVESLLSNTEHQIF